MSATLAFAFPATIDRPCVGSRPSAPLRLFCAKEMIFLEGEPMEFAYRVVEGAVRLHRMTPDGRRQLVGFACLGDWLAVGAGSSHSHTAEALVDSRLSALSRAEMNRRMKEDPSFSDFILNVAVRKLRQAEDQMIVLGRRNALEKVASFLVTLGRRIENDDGDMHLPMDRSDIADYLGLTIETVSRKFTQLKRAGVIELPCPSHVRIRERWTLEAIAEGDGTVH